MNDALMLVTGAIIGMALFAIYLYVLAWWGLNGMSLLKLFNIIARGLLGRVLVCIVDIDTGKTVRYFWDEVNKHSYKETK